MADYQSFIRSQRIQAAVQHIFLLFAHGNIARAALQSAQTFSEVSSSPNRWEVTVSKERYTLRLRVYYRKGHEGFEVTIFNDWRELLTVIYEEATQNADVHNMLQWHFFYSDTMPDTLSFLLKYWIDEDEMGLLKVDLSNAIPDIERGNALSPYMMGKIKKLVGMVSQNPIPKVTL